MRKAAVILLFIFSLGWILFSIGRISNSTAPDFSVLWLIAKDFYKTANPYLNPNIYTPSGYPPFSYLFYIPLTIFSQKIAQWTFSLISLASILGSIYLSQKLVFKKINIYHFLFASALTLLAFPTKFTLGMGQINGIAFFLLLSAYFIGRRKDNYLSGTLMGIAIMLKPIFGFFLLFFLFEKKRKTIFYSLGTILTGFILTTLGYGFSLWQYWMTKIVPPLMNFAGRETYYNQGFVGFVSRFTTDIDLRRLCGYIFALITLFLLIFFRKRKSSNLMLSLLILSLLLADSLSWQHHFVWLIFPFVVLFNYAQKMKSLWPYVLLMVSYVFIAWNFKNPGIFTKFPETLLLSNAFFGTLILYALNFFL